MLTVKNGNKFDFSGRFNGRDYRFPKGKTVAIPEDAARHIFGVGEQDKTDVLVRHGWMRHSSEYDKGMEILNKFSFDVADTFDAGDVLEEKGQGSAPLQTGGDGEPEVSDGTEEEPSQSASEGGSTILDSIPAFGGQPA